MIRSTDLGFRWPARLLGALFVVAILNLMVVAAVPGPSAAPAGAIDHSQGLPGFCATDVGVTVIVDFQQLGGTTIVRCNPQANRGTGLDALKGAGFQIEGVQRWGESFICRIENRPSAVETIPIEGDENYRERCIDTPPASGYWSYWYAGNNCAWNYSQWGVKNRDFVPGGFEAWSFSLNASPDANPEPRVAAVRPGTEDDRCDAPHEPPPRSEDPRVQQPGGGRETGSGAGAGDAARPGGSGAADGGAGPTGPGGGSDGPSGSVQRDETPGSSESAGGRDLPAPKPRDATEAPAETTSATDGPNPTASVEISGGEEEPDVREVLAEQSGSSAAAPWVAGGVVVALVGAMWWTSRRRRTAVER